MNRHVVFQYFDAMLNVAREKLATEQARTTSLR